MHRPSTTAVMALAVGQKLVHDSKNHPSPNRPNMSRQTHRPVMCFAYMAAD